MIFQKYDLSLERCIFYVKLLLFALAFVAVSSSLSYNESAVRNHKTIQSVKSSSLFRVAQNAIENFYLGVQGEISLVHFIVGHGAQVNENVKQLDTLLQYGEFISLSENGSVADYEVGPIQKEILRDNASELAVIKSVALNSALCVKDKNQDDSPHEVRRMVYHLPVSALSQKLKEALEKIEGQQDFSIVDRNYNEIYQPSHRLQSSGLKECSSIYSSLDNELYFCQSDSIHTTYLEAVVRVLSIIFPLFIVLGLLFFLKKLEVALVRDHTVTSPAQDIVINPLLTDKTPTNSSNFISCVTHELRTPLNVIIAFSEMIKDECLGSINNKKYVCYGKEIYKFGINLLKTVDNIIDVTKSNNMLMVPKRDLVGIPQLVAEAVKNCKSLALEKEISLCKSIDPNLPELFLDRTQVKKAIVNILSNAIKFSQNGATVSIKVQQNISEKSISIIVEDSGVGMMVVDGIPKLENSFTKKAGGLGIGLLLSRNIIRLNNGSLDIHSQVGKGTRSIITFYQQQTNEATDYTSIKN